MKRYHSVVEKFGFDVITEFPLIVNTSPHSSLGTLILGGKVGHEYICNSTVIFMVEYFAVMCVYVCRHYLPLIMLCQCFAPCFFDRPVCVCFTICVLLTT